MFIEPIAVTEAWSVIFYADKLIRRLNKEYPASNDVAALQMALWQLADVLPRQLSPTSIEALTSLD